MQSFLTVLPNLDKFAYLGGFSGNSGRLGGIRSEDLQRRRFAAPAAFNKKIKVLFLGDRFRGRPATKNFSDAVTKAGIHNVYFESPGPRTNGSRGGAAWRISLPAFSLRWRCCI